MPGSTAPLGRCPAARQLGSGNSQRRSTQKHTQLQTGPTPPPTPPDKSWRTCPGRTSSEQGPLGNPSLAEGQDCVLWAKGVQRAVKRVVSANAMKLYSESKYQWPLREWWLCKWVPRRKSPEGNGALPRAHGVGVGGVGWLVWNQPSIQCGCMFPGHMGQRQGQTSDPLPPGAPGESGDAHVGESFQSRQELWPFPVLITCGAGPERCCID